MSDRETFDWQAAAENIRRDWQRINAQHQQAQGKSVAATAQDALATISRLTDLLAKAAETRDPQEAEPLARDLNDTERQLGFQIGAISNLLRFHANREQEEAPQPALPE